MKTTILLKGNLIIIVTVMLNGLFLGSCHEDDNTTLEYASQNNEQIVSRASSQWHWRCKKCNLLNAGWRNDCADCSKDYSSEHGFLILTFMNVISSSVNTVSGGGMVKEGNERLIQLPGNMFPAYAPPAWYETPSALKYYEEIKRGLHYKSVSEYAEGVDYGWYRTVRVLYPGITLNVTRHHLTWLRNEGENLTDFNGRGIKDGVDAAVRAFD